MYYTGKKTKKRRRSRTLSLKITIFVLAVCCILAGTYVLAEETVRAEMEAGQYAPVTVYFHGKPYTAEPGNTAEQTLSALGLTPGAGDILSLEADTRLEAGMTLAVDVMVCRREVYTAVIPAQTRYQPDPDAPWGQEIVLEPGQDGEMRCTADVEYCNGREKSRTVISQQVIAEAKDRVVSVGMGEEVPETQVKNGYIQLPDGQILTYTHSAAVEATVFTSSDPGYSGSEGLGQGTVAVDPGFIAPGTRMYIVCADGSFSYGIGQARDCGSGMEGNRVDLCFSTADECSRFGRRSCIVYFLG